MLEPMTVWMVQLVAAATSTRDVEGTLTLREEALVFDPTRIDDAAHIAPFERSRACQADLRLRPCCSSDWPTTGGVAVTPRSTWRKPPPLSAGANAGRPAPR